MSISGITSLGYRANVYLQSLMDWNQAVQAVAPRPTGIQGSVNSGLASHLIVNVSTLLRIL